jgi:hypothetical protein
MNIKTVSLALLTIGLFSFSKQAGKQYFTKTGTISFFSSTPVEDIEAVNHQVTSAFETDGGKMQFSAMITAFEFKKALMQEHFNENYMESDKYPKATFNGVIENITAIDFKKNGTYKANVSGDLTIKDKTNKVKTIGTFKVDGIGVKGNAEFKIKLADYNIVVPGVVRDKISEDILIKVDMNYKLKGK